MRLLSKTQMAVLRELSTRRIPVLEVHAHTAASLLFKECINYFVDRGGYVRYQITSTGKTMFAVQESLDSSNLSYRSVCKEVMVKKGKAKAGSRAKMTTVKAGTKRRKRKGIKLRATA